MGESWGLEQAQREMAERSSPTKRTGATGSVQGRRSSSERRGTSRSSQTRGRGRRESSTKRTGRWESSTTEDEEDSGDQNGNRRRWSGRTDGGGHKQRIGGCGNPKTRSDTMLGMDLLYSMGAKGHRYSTCTCVQICRKPPNK
jgi:hypothetical protein